LNKLRRNVVMAAAALLCACSVRGNRDPSGGGTDQTRLTAAEIRNADPSLTLFDLISRTRPQWLTKRPGTQLQNQFDVAIYRDGIRVGGPETLRELRLDIVVDARYLTASEATSRFGLNHPHGAILVTTRRE
jgi:hypothetical protein